MFEITDQTKIPRLYAKLRLHRAESGSDGTPCWQLYHPVSHQYFQLGWVEFEYLSRFSMAATFGELRKKIEEETTLSVEPEVFKNLLISLNENGLLEDTAGLPLKPPKAEKQALLTTLAHKYLFSLCRCFARMIFCNKPIRTRPFYSRGV